MRGRAAVLFSALLTVSVLTATVVRGAQGDHAAIPAPLAGTPRRAEGLTDPVAALSQRLTTGQATLAYDATLGLLPAVLRALQVPVSSQTLVFSKTSLQSRVITARTPRALYFSDTVYVGYVPDGTLLELAAVDPQAGTVFYTIAQAPGARPRLVTNADCVQCHATPATLSLPGFVLRSVFARPDGQVAPGTRSFLTDHTTPLGQRWGGWLVTGTAPGANHMGNAVLRVGEDEAALDRSGGEAAPILGQFDRSRYPSAESDIVALLVLDHQAQMHNLISRVRYAANQGLALTAAVEALVRYALFADEAPLPGRIRGSATFEAEFERLGPRDASGRSLRQFDLTTRLFRYPCSFLLYSEAFTALPAAARAAVLGRLEAVLSGTDDTASFGRLSAGDRSAVREILRDTLPGFRGARPLPRTASVSRSHDVPASGSRRSGRMPPPA